MMTRDRQQGMTLIGWVFLLAMLGFLVLIALRLTPIYMEYFTVVNSVKSVAEQSTVQTGIGEMRAGIGRRFVINSVKGTKPADIKLARDEGKVFLHIDYEVRVPMMGNVEAVVVFDKMLEVGKR